MRLVPLLLAALALGACGSQGGGDSAAGPLTVAELVEQRPEGEVRVAGYVLERAGEARLCDAILESYPPQCGEPSVALGGAVPAPGAERTTLAGVLEGDRFTVSP